MTTLFSLQLYLQRICPNSASLAESAFKVVAILLAAQALSLLLRRQSATARSWVWRCAFLALLAAATWMLPLQNLNLIKPRWTVDPASLKAEQPFLNAVSAGMLRTPDEAKVASEERELQSRPQAPEESPPWTLPKQQGVHMEDFRPGWLTFMERWLFTVWVAGGTLLMTGKLARAAMGLLWLRRSGIAAPAALTRTSRSLAEELGLASVPVCRMVPKLSSPLVTGWAKPVIWLPEEAASWSSATVESVLVHELAHWKRRDGFWQWVAVACACVWWWHPLVWRALQQLKAEAEVAADDVVIQRKMPAPDYAEVLMQIARNPARHHTPQAGVPMLGHSPLERRVRAILADNPWRGLFGWQAKLATIALLLVGVVGSGMVLAYPQEKIVSAFPVTKEQDALAERALTLLKEHQEQLRYVHFKLEGTYEETDKLTGAKVVSTLPMKMEAWVDTWKNLYRAEYRPNVSRWLQGWSDFSVRDETVVNDGISTSRFESEEEVDMHKSGPSELFPLIGLKREQDLIRDLTVYRSLSETEDATFRNDLREVIWQGRKVLQYEITLWRDRSKGPHQINTYIIDPDHGGALVFNKLSHPGFDDSFSSWTLLDMAETSEGLAYARRSQHTNDRDGKVTVLTYTVSSLERLAALPADILNVPSPAPASPRLPKTDVVRREELQVHFVDAGNGQALPGVMVEYEINKAKRVSLAADERGMVKLPLPFEEVTRLRIWGRKEGFTVQYVQWRKNIDPVQLPEVYTMKLSPASRIAGRVVGEKGTPISGATVDVSQPGTHWTKPEFVDAHDLWNKKAVTNNDGVWELPGFPVDLSGLDIRVSHPDYQATTDYGSSDFRTLSGQDYTSLRNGTSRITLKEGRIIAGVVVDESGTPVKDCKLTLGGDRHGTNLPETTSGLDGSFVFKGQPEKPGTRAGWLTAEASRFKPVAIPLPANGSISAPLRITLQPGPVLHARVVKEDGSPSAGLNVWTDRWKELRTLQFGVRTDAEGRFTWNGAPDEAVSFSFGAGQEREFLNGLFLTAGEEEQTVVMRPALRVRGTVVDAGTGLPLQAFVVTRGFDRGAGEIYWDRQSTETFRNGTFVWYSNYIENRPTQLLIEADGYESTRTPAYPSEQQTVEVNLKMKPVR